MKRALTKILARLGVIALPQAVQVFQVGESVEWTKEDSEKWKAFLVSPTGQNLWKKARTMQVANCVKACDGELNPKTASGISFTLNWMEKLCTISGESPVKDSTIEDSLHDTADTLAPELSYV